MKTNILAAQAAAIVLAMSVLTVQAQTTQKKTPGTTHITQDHNFLNVESDSIGDPVQRITTYRNGTLYKIKVENEKITELAVDGKDIPAADFPKYQSLVTQILEQVKRDQEQAAKDRAQAELDRQQAEKDRAQADKDRQQADKDRVRAEMDREQAVKDREQAARDRQQAEKDRAQAEVDRKHAEEERKMIDSLITGLVQENIIKSKDDLVSLELSDKVLMVNDKAQPDALLQKFKTSYLKTPTAHISYYNGGNTKRISIDNK
ncbi:cell envelope integrity protein TolA [Deminuibacter soli]|uniref:Uncharacterized protein n=1 Tax=Deminuibacter soli TaxID=2291815 RepID=A0A3E1NGB2_9BACT|nr:cell envelope integrity protein TolA [Deminuibacter soli]RFM26989.1 hypothetical protein DXN05_16030 [Deminuibacter soli]